MNRVDQVADEDNEQQQHLSLIAVHLEDSEIEAGGVEAGFIRARSPRGEKPLVPTLGLQRTISPGHTPTEQSPRDEAGRAQSPRRGNAFVRGAKKTVMGLTLRKKGRAKGTVPAQGASDASTELGDSGTVEELASATSDESATVQLALDALPLVSRERLLHSFSGILWAYDGHNPDAMRPGIAFLTNAEFGFLPLEGDQGFRVALQMVAAVNKIGRKTSRGEVYFVEVTLHDFRVLRLAVSKVSDQRSQLFDLLIEAAFVDSLDSFFALQGPNAQSSSQGGDTWGWSTYVAEEEFKRQFSRVGKTIAKMWRVFVNCNYSVSLTYPKVLVVPESMDDSLISRAAQFRSRGRFPALSYLHRNGCSITRAAQPLVGLQSHRSMADEALVDAIRTASGAQEILILDCRPKANVVANQAMGKGCESEKNYQNSRIRFGKIANIHVMREALQKLSEEIAQSRTEALSSGWMDHVRRVLLNGIDIAAKIHIEEIPVLVHCSDGWDRTAQLASVAMMLLDPFYRTLKGFSVLVEKEWIAFGHQFAKRIGHEPRKMSSANDSERSPVFLQFLDVTFQLLNLCPCSFEFNTHFLSDLLWKGVYSCHFGSFLCNSAKESDEANLRLRSESFWTFVDEKQRQSQCYSNLFYLPDGPEVILPKVDFASITLAPFYLLHYEPKPKVRLRSIIQPMTAEDAYQRLVDENRLLRQELAELK